VSAVALATPVAGAVPPGPAEAPGLTLREAVPADIEDGGRVLYEAFATLAARHGFPADFPTVEVATSCMRGLITNPGFHGVVAERDGAFVGSAFLDERSTIRAIGPVSVDPAAQDGRIGRALMEALLERAAATRAPGVRLVQISYHNRSLSLYTKLGFDVRETFAALSGPLSGGVLPGYAVRPAEPRDEAASNALCVRVHGHDRAGEVGPAIGKGRARVVERLGRITGYATGIGYFDHAVAETTDDLVALISSVGRIEPPGIVVPLSNPELFRWCLSQGLRVFFVLNLMAIGMYQQPRGAWLASIGY
jgi:GNAT superfamily N-acetyltransferase